MKNLRTCMSDLSSQRNLNIEMLWSNYFSLNFLHGIYFLSNTAMICFEGVGKLNVVSVMLLNLT